MFTARRSLGVLTVMLLAFIMSSTAHAASLPRVNRSYISDYITYPVANFVYETFARIPGSVLGLAGVLTPQERVELSTAPHGARIFYWVRDVVGILGPCIICRVGSGR
jgi:hypothetical protein